MEGGTVYGTIFTQPGLNVESGPVDKASVYEFVVARHFQLEFVLSNA